MTQTQDEIIISGSLLSMTLFEQKLMRNFYIINSKLKKLESVRDIETKMKNVEKQMKFLTTKVQSLVDKIPKDGPAVSKRQVLAITKDQILDILNNPEQKLKQSDMFKNIFAEIEKVKTDIKSVGKNYNHSNTQNKDFPAKQTSFTAGTILLSESKKNSQPSKQILNEVLSKQENQFLNQIMSKDNEKNQLEKIKQDIENLYDTIDNLKVIVGKTTFVQKEMNEYDRLQRAANSKSQQGGKKRKSPNKAPVQNLTQEQQKTQIYQSHKNLDSKKGQLSVQFQRNNSKSRIESNIQGKSEIIVKQDLIARKTLNQQLMSQHIKTPNTLVNRDELSGMFINQQSQQNHLNPIENKVSYSTTHQHFNKLGELNKVEYIPQNKLVSKAQRSKSLKKLQRVERKLKVDDIKDINSVLKEIQLRLQAKINQEYFSQYIREIEEKLEILRISKDPSNQISDLRKMVYNLDTRMQSIINYLQAITNQDDALVVKKNWTCISCDKMVQKFNGKVGQHLGWNSIQAKKISPTKIGAFGQANQLASKIKNLMQNGQ